MDIKELSIQNEWNKQNHPWEYARCVVVNSILKRHIKNFSPNSTVLDVGCGDLFFINDFCQRYNSFRPIAVDSAFDEELMATLKNKYNKIDVKLYKDIAQVETESKVSLVFLLDVLEHIQDDRAFLDTLLQQEYIGKDTQFMITVPAFNSVYVDRDKWLGHYRRYSRKQIMQVMKDSNLQIIESGYFFTFPLLIRFIESLKKGKKQEEQNFNTETGIGSWSGGKLVTYIYKSILLCDFYFFRLFHFLGIKVPGLSTYVVCKLA